ncbi:MAG: class III signal peptide-containing protein [Methanosphaera sp.]|nr:class III signal peptide-containing protein [Methanosphaera sp.]
MNNKGQISLEYILFSTIILVMIMVVATTAADENEKNIIIDSARLGAQEGVDKNAYAMYYNDTFNHYQSDYPRLLYPTDIDIINITLKETSTNKLQITTYAHSNTKLTSNEKYIISSRINYYTRRSITNTFKQKQNGIYYTPALSDNYEIECEDVRWV